MLPEVSIKATQVFLNHFSATLPPDAHAVLVLDRAGWHGSRHLVVPDNITLMPLPIYSPELNPVERVWLHLREHFLSHRVLDTPDEVVIACCDAWNRLKFMSDHPWIARITS